MYRVVLVEDDPMVLMLNRKFTEKDKRFQIVHEFGNGHDALHWLVNNPVDLIVLDLYMPVLTGLELLRQLRGRKMNVDVIMVTAAHDAPTLDALLKLGVTDYLVKPFTYPRFQQALEAFCQQRQALEGHNNVSQAEIDRLLTHSGESPAAPKGLQEKTLQMIRSFLQECGTELTSSEEIAAHVGLSAVTVRRYMAYLLELHEVSARVDYDTGGRPCMRYCMPESKQKPQ